MARDAIHNTAIVSPGAELGAGVRIGPQVIVEEGVTIGAGCRLEAGVIIKKGTVLGEDNLIRERAILGGDPQHTGYGGEPTFLRIGRGNVIGEFVTMHRAFTPGGETLIGDENTFMSYSHVGHDCRVGNACVMANYAALAGFVTVEDSALLAGYAGVHQYVRIGRMAMIAGGAKIGKDAVPFMIYQGIPARAVAVNLVALQRNGVSPGARSAIRRLFKILFRKSSSIPEALKRIRREVPPGPEIAHIIAFIEAGERGVGL